MKISSFNEHALPSCLKNHDFEIKRLEAFSPELEKLNHIEERKRIDKFD